MRLVLALWGGLKGGLLFWLQITAIVTALIMMLELMRSRGLFDRFARACRPLARFLSISEEAMFPLVIGLIFGLTFGAAIIIDEARRGIISGRDMFLVGVFVGLCHSVPEDTFTFMRVGANGLIMAGVRLGAALVMTLLLGRGADWLRKGSRPANGRSEPCLTE